MLYRYRGSAHSSCNISYQGSRIIPVVFHNLSGYDSHLFIKEVASCFNGRVSLLPQTKERYISFTKFVEGTDVNLRFIDSFRFMASSLDKLASYLENLPILEKYFQQDDAFSIEQIMLLKRKGVFPYDYVSSFEKLKETNLPSKDDFFSSLHQSHISDEDYEHAKKVWQMFNIQDLGQYSDLHMKTDVILLAEVYENFRMNCRQAYDLDPAHYYTTPRLTWEKNKTLHDAHKDLPFYAEHMASPGSKQKKLMIMTTLHDKERYVLHYRALKQALKHGLILTKVHRAIKFNQRSWLKKYIDLNSAKRKDAKNEFEKMLFKLFNNAVYGKTMENERKLVDVKLVNKWESRCRAEAYIAKPNFHSCDIFDKNLVAIQLLRTEISIRKPIYVGLSVLDLSKTLVNRFHYEYMKNRVGDNCKILYTATDSLIYEITNVNIYDIMRQGIHEGPCTNNVGKVTKVK